MFNHAPADYQCPFCAVANQVACEGTMTQPLDIVFRDDEAIAFVASHWWPADAGHVLIIPCQHFENLYDLPDNVAASIAAVARRIAIAMKEAYNCAGISTRQHNEPAGYQEVWHYYLHLFPRYINDGYSVPDSPKRLTRPDERLPFALKLRRALQTGIGDE